MANGATDNGTNEGAKEGMGGFCVLLDDKPVKTPNKVIMSAPNAGLAEAIADEWRAQDEVISPDSMKLTTLLITAIDRTIPERGAISQTVLQYLNGELICYRSPEGVDTELDIEEARLWNPWMEWFAQRFGHRLHTTTDLGALQQSDDAHGDMATYINGLDVHVFNILQVVTAISGSLVLALAFIEGEIDAKGIFEASLCEELFFVKRLGLEMYGHDPITEKKHKNLLADYEACQRYLSFFVV